MTLRSYPPAMTLRPITSWPHAFTNPRRNAPFRAYLRDTLTKLDQELRLLDPKDRLYPPSVLEIAIAERDFRLDGMPRANAQPDHPGVILNIEPRAKPALSFPCDTFDHWHDNLRAITLTLEALRRIDRYGVTNTGQQYHGWRAIEAKPLEPEVPAEQLVTVLAVAAGLITPVADTSPENLARIWRTARANTHPDTNDGDRAVWDRVEKAANQLRRMGWLP
jgi:hypothetical protein